LTAASGGEADSLIESLKSKSDLIVDARQWKNLTHLQSILLFKDLIVDARQWKNLTHLQSILLFKDSRHPSARVRTEK
jgi:hypothetical protein